MKKLNKPNKVMALMLKGQLNKSQCIECDKEMYYWNQDLQPGKCNKCYAKESDAKVSGFREIIIDENS